MTLLERQREALAAAPSHHERVMRSRQVANEELAGGTPPGEVIEALEELQAHVNLGIVISCSMSSTSSLAGRAHTFRCRQDANSLGRRLASSHGVVPAVPVATIPLPIR